MSFDKLALGADIRIPTLGGMPVTLKIPAGTPNGRTFRVRGKGAYRRHLRVATGHRERPRPGRPRRQARAAVQTYREATAGKPLRANLFESAS